jgi:hypothetical protein
LFGGPLLGRLQLSPGNGVPPGLGIGVAVFTATGVGVVFEGAAGDDLPPHAARIRETDVMRPNMASHTKLERIRITTPQNGAIRARKLSVDRV